MKIVIKVGSQSLLLPSGELRAGVIDNLIQQISKLQQAGHQVLLVSSGAVALGRSCALQITQHSYGSSVADKQLLAALGQPRLMALYAESSAKQGIAAAQLLLTKYDFKSKRSYTNILRLLQKSLAQSKVLTIINENDSVAVDELMFTDNDELAGIIAAQIGADKLLLLTSTNGVYDRHPQEAGAQLLEEIKLSDPLPIVSADKTALGRGGMSSKLHTARKCAVVGVMTHIAALDVPNIIERLVNDEPHLGTRVMPNHKKSARKKFLAFGLTETVARVSINNCLSTKLKQADQSISILAIGISEIHGEFSKGDLVELCTADGLKVGIGVARYNSHKLAEYLGQKNQPPFIHYDYLHIF